MKFGFDWPSGLRGGCFIIMEIYMYIAPGQGADNPPGAKIFH